MLYWIGKAIGRNRGCPRPRTGLRRRSTVIVTTLAMGFLALGAALPALADCPAPSPETDVAVGVREAPPFITHDDIRGQRGFAVELWKGIERELQGEGIVGETEWIECSLSDQLLALRSGDLDVVISPLTITAERQAYFPFTQQYLGSGITVAQSSGNVINFGYAAGMLADTIKQPGVPGAIFLFLLLNLVFIGLVSWTIKHHVHFDVIGKESFPLRLARPVLETVVRTTGLHGMSSDFRSTTARALDAIMAIIGTVLSATIFGVLTAALIGSIGAARDVAITDLPDLKVATLADSTSQAFVESLYEQPITEAPGQLFAAQTGGDNGFAFGRRAMRASAAEKASSYQPAQVEMADNRAGDLEGRACRHPDAEDESVSCLLADSWFEAMQMLEKGEVDAVVGDWAQLSYLSRLPVFDDQVHVQAAAFKSEPYGWGVNPERPELLHAINRALIERIRNPQWRYFVQEYLGTGSIGTN
ncbi:MAG: transporter substrate-binding domain-containing protein [Marinobacter sp.]